MFIRYREENLQKMEGTNKFNPQVKVKLTVKKLNEVVS